jgi:hypothetical protein
MADEVALALLCSMFGGALIGGVGMMLSIMVKTGGQPLLEKPLSLLLGPLLIGAFSMFVVIPCTIVFALPSVAMIHRLALGRWAALAVCLAAALATQIGAVRLFFWQEWSRPEDFLFTTPFALGAAVVLWWRMTRA